MGQGLCGAVDDRDLDMRFARCTGSEPPQVWLRLDGQNLGDSAWVVGEVAPVARTDLENPPAQAGKQLRALAC